MVMLANEVLEFLPRFSACLDKESVPTAPTGALDVFPQSSRQLERHSPLAHL